MSNAPIKLTVPQYNQLPDTARKSGKGGYLALVNGKWREVELEKPKPKGGV